MEKSFYQNVLGIGSSFYFVEGLDGARLSAIGNRGFLPVADMGKLPDARKAIKRIPLYNQSRKRIQLNYCAFWKKERTNYYIEEFVSIIL